MAKPKPPSYSTQPTDDPIQVSEPFRVFFPLGLIAAGVGTLLWPLHYAGWWTTFPNQQHPRIMVFGFGAAFLAGFLGTAWPRFLESVAMRKWEVAGLAGAWFAMLAFYLFGPLRSGDLAAAWFLVVLAMVLAWRFRDAQDLPPPGFALAFLSILLGAGVLIVWVIVPVFVFPRLSVFLRLLAYQGFLLLPILGVGSYLFARFFQIAGERPPFVPPKRRMLAVLVSAFLILLSFGIESVGWIRSGNLLRLCAVVCWALLAVPMMWKGKAPTTRAWALRIGIVMIALSFLLRAIWPGQVFAYEHLLFLGGFGLVILLTADRVVAGHCIGIAKLPVVSKSWRFIAWFLLLTAATRVSADLKASLYRSHQVYAALMWCLVLASWFWIHRKHLWSGIAEE